MFRGLRYCWARRQRRVRWAKQRPILRTRQLQTAARMRLWLKDEDFPRCRDEARRLLSLARQLGDEDDRLKAEVLPKFLQELESARTDIEGIKALRQATDQIMGQ